MGGELREGLPDVESRSEGGMRASQVKNGREQLSKQNNQHLERLRGKSNKLKLAKHSGRDCKGRPGQMRRDKTRQVGRDHSQELR